MQRILGKGRNDSVYYSGSAGRVEAPRSNASAGSTLVRDVLIVLVVAMLIWSVWLQVQVRHLNAEVARLSGPIRVTGFEDRKFANVNDLALALLHVHEREQGLEKAIEEDIHAGGRLGIHTHQYIDRKVWAADARSRDVITESQVR